MQLLAPKIKNKIKRACVKSGIAVFGTSPPIRFVILGSARSGSNLLSYALKSHDNVQFLGEIFNIQAASNAVLNELLSEPRKYVDRVLNQKFSRTKKALGFKLFYNQMTAEQVECKFYSTYFISRNDVSDEEADQIDRLKRYINNAFDTAAVKKRIEGVWSYLQANTGIKILHLRRNNRLKQYLSICRAWQSNQWKSINSVRPAQASSRPIFLEHHNCQQFFEKLSRWEETFLRYFSNHATHEVLYERLKLDPHGELAKVQAFLGLSLKKLDIPLQKQRKCPASEAIENFKELKSRFKFTCYEPYFED